MNGDFMIVLPGKGYVGDERRCKRLEISAPFFLSWMKPGCEPQPYYKVAFDGLPSDVKVQFAYYDPPNDSLHIILQSMEWPVVPEGMPVPYTTIVFQESDTL